MSLVDRAKKTFLEENLPKGLQSIRKFASWNGYPKNIVNFIIKRVPSKKTLTNDVISNEEKDKIPTVFINIDYPWEKGEHLLKKYFKKLGRSTKISFFTKMKDKLDILSKSNVVYQFSCPCCESSYIGKTEQTLFERTKQHLTRADSAIKGLLDNCSNAENLFKNIFLGIQFYNE